MNAHFELFRFMLVRPPNDASDASVPLPGPTDFQKNVDTASRGGSVDRMREHARNYAGSGSFVGGIEDLQNGVALRNVSDRLTGATDPSIDDARASIRAAFKSDPKALFAGALRSAPPRRQFGKIASVSGDGPLVPDFIQASDSILAVKILSDSSLADLDELVQALAVMMLIRRIALDDAALKRSGAIAAALAARVSVPHFLLPISGAAVAAEQTRLAAAAAPPGKIVPANAAMCAELKRLKLLSQQVYDAMIALRSLSAPDFNCPCPPHSATRTPRAIATDLPARTRAAATLAKPKIPVRPPQPGDQRLPTQRMGPPRTWSPCPPDKGEWPCPPPLALRPEAIARLDPGVRELLAKLNTGVTLITGIVAGRVVVTCAPPHNAPKECGCAD
jgi:hypothetical protein